MKDYINTSTTYNNYEGRGELQMDYILLSDSLKGSDFRKIENFSDHYACAIDCKIK